MRPSNGEAEPRSLPSLPKPIERFGKTKGSKVLLLVGHDDLLGGFCQFLVSRSCLYNLGERWQELLSERSKIKSKRLFSTSPKAINLRDEHANSIRLIMHIAHLQFAKLPKSLDFREIVHLADVAARYDAHSLLVSHIDAWLAPYRDRLLHPGYEEWLFIAHQFGYETEYLELAKHLAIHCRVDPSGTWLLAPGTDYILEGRFPVDTLGTLPDDGSMALMRRCTHTSTLWHIELIGTDHINEGRRQILFNMLQATYDLWTSISQGLNCRVADEDEPEIRKGCAAINLFEFTRYLRGLELFPMLNETTNFQSSPYELSVMLSNAQQMIPIASTLSVGRRGSPPVQSGRHSQCHIGHQLAGSMAKVLKEVNWPVEIPRLMSIKLNAGEYRHDAADANADASVDEKFEKQSERNDEADDFLDPQCALERRFKGMKRAPVAALDADPNVLNER